MTGEILYLDASALVKVFREEPESDAMAEELRRWGGHAMSVVGDVEVRRAALRAGADSHVVERVLSSIAAIELDEGVRELASSIEPPALRALGAIHLASAISLEDDLGAIACYDERLATAARAAGIAVVSPS
jgi:predicted nucleic acid-binding protein